MKDFKQQLKLYLQGQIQREQLLQTMAVLVSEQPELAEKIIQGLQQMADRQLISSDDHSELVEVINRHRTGGMSAALDDATVVRSEPDDKTAVRLPSGQGVSPQGEDKTRLTEATDAPLNSAIETGSLSSVSHNQEDSSRINSANAASPTPTVTSTGTSTSRWNKPFADHATDETAMGVGSVIKERFRLVEFIGCGGMGDVYKAEDQRRLDAHDHDSLVAIKVLNKTFREHPESLRSLQREARKTQNLAHPNIVNVFDFDRDRDNVFMTMELMQGAPLSTVIKANPAGLSPDRVLDYVAGMAGALGYAHQQGIVHSDFKPSNVFLNNGQIKVFDFGIARAAKSAAAPEDSFDAGDLGALTPSYASPAMLDGAATVDARDDLYALGCIIYELVCGKHPFIRNGKKVPADEARLAGMKMVELKQLNRNQNKALRQLLSFDEQQRTASVETFLQQFLPQHQRHSLLSRWYVWVMMLLFVCGIAYFPLLNLLHQQQIDDFVDDLKNRDNEAVKAWLDKIQSMDTEQQNTFYNDTQVKRELTRYFLNQVAENADADAYSQAQQLADRALQIYEDSRRLSDKQEQLIKQKAERLNVLNNELNRALELPTTAFVSALIELKALLASIRRVDAGSAMLGDARIPVKLSETIVELIDLHQFSSAQRVGQVAMELFPDNQELNSTTRKLELERLRFNRATRISELQRQLNSESLNNLDNFIEVLPVIKELQQLEPGNDRLNQLQQQLSRLLVDEQQRFIDAHAWQEAEDLLVPFVGVLIPADLVGMELTLKQSLDQYQRFIDEQVAGIDTDILGQRLESAEQRISSLKPTIADQRTIIAVSDRLASAWIKQSRSERDQHNWEASSEALARIVTLDVSPELLQTIAYEQQQLEQLKQMTEQELAASVLAGENSAKQAELQTLQSELTGLLQSAELSDSTTRKAQSLLDRIDALKGDQVIVTQGRKRMVQRYTEQAVAAADADVNAAIRILQDGKRLLPESSEITDLLAQFQARQESASEQEKVAQLASLKQQLDQLLDNPEVTPEWEKRVGALFSRLTIEQNDPAYIQGINTRLAIAYHDQAKRLTELNDFNAARDLLRRAAEYDSSIETLNATDEAISEAENAFQQAQAERKNEAFISGLKQTFDTQIQANDLSAARQTFTRLKSELGEADPFVTQQAPQTFQTVYLRLADQLAARKRFSQAEKLMLSARGLLADQEIVDQRIAEYQNGARLYHVTQAIKNPEIERVVKAAGLLPELKPQLSAEKYQQLSRDLQAAVIDRVNSLTARSPVQAKQLLQKAQQLFPDNRSLQQLNLSSSTTSRSTQTGPKPVSSALSNQSAGNANRRSDQEAAQAPVSTPDSATRVASDRICTRGLAGKGIRSAAVCWDMLTEQSKAPFMIVVPGKSRSYAISKFEISRSDYNLYCKLSGDCNAIGGTQKLPVTGLSQARINKYIAWLSNTTGYQYRIPDKDQWVHAAKATGGNQPQNYNCRLSRGAQILKGRDLVSVQQGRPNAWGLVNYLGNAQELVKSGSGFEAVGGSYRVKMSDCSVSLSVSVSGITDKATGFRLIREL